MAMEQHELLGQCQALKLSDTQRCEQEATHANGLFCWLHSKQAYGLYMGYKRRNKKLDAFDDAAPASIKHADVPLANQTFESVTSQVELNECHDHLLEKSRLLTHVIEARKIHHQSFYSISYDYGHQLYLDKLISQRHVVMRALERIQKRIADVLYRKEAWFSWVREAQREEEATRDKEQKKIRQEAALFKRHWKQLQARLEKARLKEEQLRQDAYLEEAYQERLASVLEDDDEAWDPIQDLDSNKRQQYIDLIRHFLWLGELEDVEEDAKEETADAPAAELAAKVEELSLADGAEPAAKKGKKKKKSKGKSAAAKAQAQASTSTAGGDGDGEADENKPTPQSKLLAIDKSGALSRAGDAQPEPDKSRIETEEEMRKRLAEGVEKIYETSMSGMQLVGTIENPVETLHKTAPLTGDEIEEAVRDIREIKLLLFCRLLLGHVTLLPAAIRASSVEALMRDGEVSDADLRDLCLKLEEPTLQDIRDACADFARDDAREAANDAAWETDDGESDDDAAETMEELLRQTTHYQHLHTKDWLKERVLISLGHGGEAPSKPDKIKITVCGKSIWNHASEEAMSRDGWFQFSIMTRDCDLKHAMQLCRNWAEFSDLNLLTMWQLFPTASWSCWGGDRLMQQMQEMNFFPYFVDFDAEQRSRSEQSGGRRRSGMRRQHQIVEQRNIMIGHMKRDDPIMRRFLHYLLMRAGEVLVLVRDGKTGRVITAPDDEHLWTVRAKIGLGRASKNEWKELLSVGQKYFDLVEKYRQWRLGFDDYYDIYIWDFVPGQQPFNMYTSVISELRKAWRFKHLREVYYHMQPILENLTRPEETMRTRLVKPGEKVRTLWDVCTDPRNRYLLYGAKDLTPDKIGRTEETEHSIYTLYSEANVVEDRVLFPDELVEGTKSLERAPFREIKNGINQIESRILPSVNKGLTRQLEAIMQGRDPDDDAMLAMVEEEKHLWVWGTGLDQLQTEKLSEEQEELLERTGLQLPYVPASLEFDPLEHLEIMERNRAVGFKDSFHKADTEPGGPDRYYEVQNVLGEMIKTTHTGSTAWVLFIAETLDWLGLRADYNEVAYATASSVPWPHSFIAEDMVLAFATMAMFFPGVDEASLVHKFLGSSQWDSFRESSLFKPRERSRTLPDTRRRTSFKYREGSFWHPWENFVTSQGNDKHYTGVYPFDWSLAIRPIIAQLYMAGIIAPARLQPNNIYVLGCATANTEPHRPGKLDLFISYADHLGLFPFKYPPNFIGPDQWPQLLPLARKFASSRHGVAPARFALLRIWSAPHFYPLMVGLSSRHNTSFLDSAGRSWIFKFLSKDFPGSEFSIHNATTMRLSYLQQQFEGRVVHRGDLVLVMADDERELLKYVTAVTFVLQTKPWFRELDLYKSFVNVDLDFLEDLNPFWLD